jgi:threonine synthase
MDIQVASNFERYLFYLFDENPSRVVEAFRSFAENGRMDFTPLELEKVRTEFSSRSVNRDETLATIAAFHRQTGYLLDPHTAVGVRAAQDCVEQGETPVCLATAHPAKFGEAVEAATGIAPPYPTALAGIEKLPTRCEVLEADIDLIKSLIETKAV